MRPVTRADKRTGFRTTGTKMSNERIETGKVTRVEVIDEDGRVFTKWSKHMRVEVQMQDEGRTLKVFISSHGEL